MPTKAPNLGILAFNLTQNGITVYFGYKDTFFMPVSALYRLVTDPFPAQIQCSLTSVI